MKKKDKKESFILPKENIKERNIAEFCKEIIMLFGANVNLARAVPDAKDNLKPSARRILYGMKNLKLKPDGKNVKCARIIGDVLGKYHP